MTKGIDIIVFGATGYTGKFVVKYLVNLTKEKYCEVTWGIAGRSMDKLQKLMTEINNTNLTAIKADVENEESLKNMLQDVKIVINCTGPNILFSPPLVKACIETGTHYIDISAEMIHILKLYQDYNKAAEDANVLIIPACGFSTIPADAALMYLERQFKGTLHTVECYTRLYFPVILPFGKVFLHTGTWTSLVYVLETFKDYLALRDKILPKTGMEPPEMKRSFFHRKNGKWWFPYPGIENDGIEMSQRYMQAKTGKKPIQFKAYTTVQCWLHYIIVPFIFICYYLCYFKAFRKLLINYPRLCTLGIVSEKGPSDKDRLSMKYDFVLNGKGWGVDDDKNSEPTKTMSVKVSGRDPGYHTTAIAIVMCAITTLKEGSNMPKGGVIMAGAAFHETGIVDRLINDKKRGVAEALQTDSNECLIEDGYNFEVLDNNM